VAEVVKGKWYPAPPPALPGESDVDYEIRLRGDESPYDHLRKRQCATAEHRLCTDRNAVSPANAFTDNKLSYTGSCKCPCHLDSYSLVAEESLRDVVQIICDVYSLPTRTGWHVVHFVDLMTAKLNITVELVRVALGREYGSEISEGFALDVVLMLSSKGPKGSARAFWKRVHTEHRQGQKLIEPLSPPMPQPEQITGIKSLGWEHLGPDPYPEDQARITEWLGKRMSRALDEAARNLNDGNERTGTWPRITVPGVETLAEALKRVNTSPPEMTMPVERVVNGHWLLAQPWFVAGVGLIDHLHASCAPSMMAGLSWRVPANLLPEPHPGAPYLMYHVPVRVDPGLPPGATPYLAFDLEESDL
jgi:hypothetical protein